MSGLSAVLANTGALPELEVSAFTWASFLIPHWAVEHSLSKSFFVVLEENSKCLKCSCNHGCWPFKHCKYIYRDFQRQKIKCCWMSEQQSLALLILCKPIPILLVKAEVGTCASSLGLPFHHASPSKGSASVWEVPLPCADLYASLVFQALPSVQMKRWVNTQSCAPGAKCWWSQNLHFPLDAKCQIFLSLLLLCTVLAIFPFPLWHCEEIYH